MIKLLPMLRSRPFIFLYLLCMILIGGYVRIDGIGKWLLSTDDTFIASLATIPPSQPHFDYHDTPFVWVTTAFMPRAHWWDLIGITPISGHPALYYILLHAVMTMTSSTFMWRLLALIPALLTIPVAYGLGRRSSGVLSGLAAALLLTFADIHIVVSQEIRSYALFTLLLSLMVYAILRYDATREKRWLVGYFGFAALALATHYGATIPITCIGSVGIWRRLRQYRFHLRTLLKDRPFIGWCALHMMLAAFYLSQSAILLEEVQRVSGPDGKLDTWLVLPLYMRLLFASWIMVQAPGMLFFPDSAMFFILPSFMLAFGLWALYRDRKYEWLVIAAASLVITWLLVTLGMHPYYAVRHFAHLYPMLVITCCYPFSQSVRIDGAKKTAVFAGVFFIFFLINVIGPGGNGLEPGRYRMALRHKCDRLYEVTQADWQALIPVLDADIRPGDMLITDQLSWLHYDWQRRRGERLPRLMSEGHYGVCTHELKLYHPIAPFFNECMRQVGRDHPEAKRFWYIFTGPQLHISTYDGETVVQLPLSRRMERMALDKIELPTVGAYALPPGFREPEDK